MNWRAWFGFPWFDGLQGRIAAALFAALLCQFIGSEVIFERIETERMERGRAARLADWLFFADEFATTRPDAVQRMTLLWEPDLTVTRSAIAPPYRAYPSAEEDAKVEQLVFHARPELERLVFRAKREGKDLKGSMRLSEGGWLVFHAKGYFEGRSQLLHYVSSILLLFLCVVLIAMFFGRMIARPLRHVASAAERVGREDAVPIAVNGPREVRQVAAAFDRMQTRLLAQLRDRLQSMAAISHDLRTPLARLQLNASTVAEAETRMALQQDIDEMEAFISSILDYLRGDDAEQEESVDIASIVMTVVDEARDRGEDAVYRGPDRLEAVTRPIKLKRLVRNVVQNATRHAGNARVELTEAAGHLVLIVADDGPGIPEGELEAVFEPFRRIETSRNKRTGGSGLGLAIARRLATRLGGTIILENRSPSGLTATVRLPCNRKPSINQR